MFIGLTHLMQNGIQMEDRSIVITNGMAATQMERCALLMEIAVLNGTHCTHSELGSALLAIRTE